MPILAAREPAVRPCWTTLQYATWQDALRDAVRDPRELCRLLELPEEALIPTALRSAEGYQNFPLFVPRGFVARMRQGDPADPLLRQVLPVAAESVDVPGFVADPVGDAAATKQPGLLHKYRGRVLLVLTGACAIHCRYCFRRHFPYSDGPRSVAEWEPALEEIAADESIHEVILSGGDPLSIIDATLAALVHRLESIPHLRRLRIHTRLPIVIPERVTEALVETLQTTRLTPIVVVHANHANELDTRVAAALAQLTGAGVPLLNQAVLLRGVNDSVEAQADLCEQLVNHRIIPYYLHQCDHVAGAAHFEVPIETGRKIVEKLRTRLPGYAVPKYVIERSGDFSKVILA